MGARSFQTLVLLAFLFTDRDSEGFGRGHESPNVGRSGRNEAIQGARDGHPMQGVHVIVRENEDEIENETG